MSHTHPPQSQTVYTYLIENVKRINSIFFFFYPNSAHISYQAISGIKSWMPLVKWPIEILRCHNVVCVHISSGFEVMAK